MTRKFQVKSLPTLAELECPTASPPRWLQEVKCLFVDKVSDQEREESLSHLEVRLNQLADLSGESCIALSDLSGQNKNSGFNALATRIFVQTTQHLDEIEAKRLQILNCLKNKQIINSDLYRSLYSLYKKVFLGKLDLEYSSDQSETWRKSCKSIMTSLKKMMILKRKQKKSSQLKKDAHRYTVNLDVKHLIKCCEIMSRDEKALNKKILDMIFKTKNGWAGPRLWKIVYEQRWSANEIDQFIQLFTSSFETFTDYRSDYKKLRIAVERILKNLKALNSKAHAEPSQTTSEWDEVMFDLPVYEKCNLEIELREYEVYYPVMPGIWIRYPVDRCGGGDFGVTQLVVTSTRPLTIYDG